MHRTTICLSNHRVNYSPYLSTNSPTIHGCTSASQLNVTISSYPDLPLVLLAQLPHTLIRAVIAINIIALARYLYNPPISPPPDAALHDEPDTSSTTTR